LGTDELILSKIDKNKLIQQKKISLWQGSGPRHLDFHPNN